MRVPDIRLLAGVLLAANLSGCDAGGGSGGSGADSSAGITPSIAAPGTEPRMFEAKPPTHGSKPSPATARPQEKAEASKGRR
jgi:hypothetical protein